MIHGQRINYVNIRDVRIIVIYIVKYTRRFRERKQKMKRKRIRHLRNEAKMSFRNETMANRACGWFLNKNVTAIINELNLYLML